MMKAKLAVFLAAATLSISASAAFVQYNFSNATFSDGGSLNGYFVQNTDDKAIAYMSMNVAGGAPHMHGAHFLVSAVSNIASASTYFAGAGPTNFSAYNNQDTMYYRVDLEFASTSTVGSYRVFGENVQFPLFQWDDAMGWTPGSRTLVSGFAVEGAIDPDLLAFVEGGPIPGINYIVPQLLNGPVRVPEPGSLALLALGAVGLFGMRRRSKIAKSV